MEELIKLIDKNLERFMQNGYPESIFKSMKYTVMLPGKRIRPIMCLESCRFFGGDIEKAIPTACAIEMLHVQSLIHDDLPCMDNDDYRRGKLSNHKVFGEAIATLAGDALLSYAPQVIIEQSKLPTDITLKVLHEFMKTAGAFGLIAGQVVDIESEQGNYQFKNDKEKYETLKFIHTHKTADLFRLALKSGAIIANANEQEIKDMDTLAQKFGLAFQIYDDILDEISSFEELGKTVGKDKNADKLTYTSLYGLEKARITFNSLFDEIYDTIGKYDSKVLLQIINNMRNKIGR